MSNPTAWFEMIRGGDCIGHAFKLLDSVGCEDDINGAE